MPASVTEIWRYPVKSMGETTIDAAAVGERGLHADRMWAVRDPALGAISTARRLPPLLRCTARYPRDPADFPAGPGNAPEVVITLPAARRSRVPIRGCTQDSPSSSTGRYVWSLCRR